MKKTMAYFSLLTCLFTAGPAWAFKEGRFECEVDAFTKAKVMVGTVEFAHQMDLPYVHYSYYKSGVLHQIRGLGTIDIQTTETKDKATGERITVEEEVLTLPGIPHVIISFKRNGEPGRGCVLVRP